MKVIVPGHTYELSDGSRVQFIKRGDDGEMIPGTTNEELLDVLVDRTKYLDQTHPCDENKKGVWYMAIAAYYFRLRHILRQQQGVLSTDLPHQS